MLPGRVVASVLLMSAILLVACELAHAGVSFHPAIQKAKEVKKTTPDAPRRRSDGVENYFNDDTEQIQISAPLEVGIAMSREQYTKYGEILTEIFKELLNVDLTEH